MGNRSGMAGGGRIAGNRGARAVEAMAAVLLLSGANGKEQRGMGAAVHGRGRVARLRPSGEGRAGLGRGGNGAARGKRNRRPMWRQSCASVEATEAWIGGDVNAVWGSEPMASSIGEERNRWIAHARGEISKLAMNSGPHVRRAVRLGKVHQPKSPRK